MKVVCLNRTSPQIVVMSIARWLGQRLETSIIFALNFRRPLCFQVQIAKPNQSPNLFILKTGIQKWGWCLFGFPFKPTKRVGPISKNKDEPNFSARQPIGMSCQVANATPALRGFSGMFASAMLLFWGRYLFLVLFVCLFFVEGGLCV